MMLWRILCSSWRTLRRKPGWLVRTFFVLLLLLLLCSGRLYVVLIKVLSASEERAWRRHSPRGRSEWVQGFVTPSLFLFIPSPFAFPSLSASSLLLLRAAYQKTSSLHPPPHFPCFHSSRHPHCKTRAVEFGVVVMPAAWGAKMCQESFAKLK